jgi:hypothetical protein
MMYTHITTSTPHTRYNRACKSQERKAKHRREEKRARDEHAELQLVREEREQVRLQEWEQHTKAARLQAVFRGMRERLHPDSASNRLKRQAAEMAAEAKRALRAERANAAAAAALAEQVLMMGET